ncbi:telomere binding protein [Verticillium nonalfalfae]|uniref:Telomere binding protein n=1 Tax=Verticillium nonalfalfae TaxID=1051616 RepID=A0A3M9YNY9_9PEZI|nr:telomere binding protein [Verticillium nonalfalfae]RNJ60770.1 telomere binding protein [Verticillium nonalfalfae]
MDDFLTPVSQTYLKPRASGSPFGLSRSPSSADEVNKLKTSSSDGTVLEKLMSQPDYDTLISALKLASRNNKTADPTSESARVIQVLVSEIIPNYWPVLRGGDAEDLSLLLRCLRNLTGVNALVARVKALTQEFKAGGQSVKRPDIAMNLDILLQVFTNILDGDLQLMALWSSGLPHLDNPVRRKAMAHELVGFFAGGKLVSIAAEAQSILQKELSAHKNAWVSDGLLYSKWLGRSIVAWVSNGPSSDDEKLCAELFVRGLRLGYSEHLNKHLIQDLLLGPDASANAFVRLFGHFSQLEQKRMLYAVVKYLADTHLNPLGSSGSPEARKKISAAAGVLGKLVANNDSRMNHLVSWLTNSTGAGLGEAIGIRRAVVAVVGNDKECTSQVLEKSLSQFGDQLYIKHSPMLQQEAHAQVLLLIAGYIHRASAVKLKMIMRSGSYLQTISNRLNSTQVKARLLGMAIGEALSSLSDTNQNKLEFKTDEMDSEEAKWYKSLPTMADEVGPVEPLVSASAVKPEKPNFKPAPAKPITRRALPPRNTGFIIEEVEDSSESEDDDLMVYNKPDDDAEDSDEDATLVRRDKPKAPVYIRDLITYLRDDNNYDKQKLALETSPSLIRRKANFGSEVSAHADELASQLVGLQDKFDIANFYELRLQSMIALIVAQPKVMAPWFAKTLYDGDYSISQRASILIVLGLSARELSGHDTSEFAAAASFPSKRLPERMERMYLEEASIHANRLEAGSGSNLKAIPATALDSIAQDLTSSFLAPLAAKAADAATGPDVLKLSSFTSRLNAQGQPKSTAKPKPRLRSIPNTIASLIATNFFFPLTARLQHALRSPASHRRNAPLFQPHLLSLYLKTLAVLIHAAGPSTLALPQMTAELWNLILGLRAQAAPDLPTTHALLIALAALFEVNAAGSSDGLRKLCADMPREIVETQEWVSGIFNGTRGDDGGQENQVKMLSAGVLITLQEAMERHRALLMGDMIGFT